MKRKILVTGGAGYVGSILVRKLLANGDDVVCVDRLMFGGAALLGVYGEPGFELHQVDIRDSAALDGVIKQTQPDCVVHLAAIVGDPACKREPELARETNIDATRGLLKSVVDNKVGQFIFASTCSNYGMVENDEFVTETSTLAPLSLYAESKVEMEKIILDAAADAPDLCATVLRFATVYGLSPRMRFDLTVNEFAKELATGSELVIYGRHHWRPYCHVRDFSEAIKLIMDSPREKIASDVFNVGATDENYTKAMLLEVLAGHFDAPNIVYQKDNIPDPRNYRVDFTKITNELGFKVTKTVPEGIADLISAIRSDLFEDCNAQRYYNIPVNPPAENAA